jgi:hypothetical protein
MRSNSWLDQHDVGSEYVVLQPVCDGHCNRRGRWEMHKKELIHALQNDAVRIEAKDAFESGLVAGQQHGEAVRPSVVATVVGEAL